MGNLPFQRKTSDLESNRKFLRKPENPAAAACQIPNFDFENNQHPLLINTVIREILKYSTILGIKNFRLVCKDWNFEALGLLKKIEWKSPILFQTIRELNSFVKVFEPCPKNILNRNLDCGQILLPHDTDMEPDAAIFIKILPIMRSITGLKVNINIQNNHRFISHDIFQPLAHTLQNFDVRFIRNDNISGRVYPRTRLPYLPALTSVKIRMDAFVKDGNRILHPEYVHVRVDQQVLKTKDLAIFDSEHKMLVKLIQELVEKSPGLSDIHLIMCNSIINNGFEGFLVEDTFKPKTIRILNNLKWKELEKITHLQFEINDEEDIAHLVTLAKSGLDRLKHISIDFVFIRHTVHVQEKILELLEFQIETLEYFKLKNSAGKPGNTKIKLPAVLPKLKIFKLAGNFKYEIDILDLSKRFPNLNEMDLTGGRGFVSQFNVPLVGRVIPCVQIKKLQLDNKSFLEFQGTENKLSEYFPNVTEVKYNLDDIGENDEGEGIGGMCLWSMRSLEHLVLKVPLYSSHQVFSAVLKPIQFLSGGMTEYEIDLPHFLPLLERVPNITWLTGLKSLKIKQRRRYGHSKALDGSDSLVVGIVGGYRKYQRRVTECLGSNILLNTQNLEHFSSHLHCFSEETILELKRKILYFEPGRYINQLP